MLSSGERDVIPLTKYDVEEPSNSGFFTERYWAVVNTPVMADGHVSMIVHRAKEMTHLIHEAQKNRLLTRYRLLGAHPASIKCSPSRIDG